MEPKSSRLTSFYLKVKEVFIIIPVNNLQSNIESNRIWREML